MSPHKGVEEKKAPMNGWMKNYSWMRIKSKGKKERKENVKN